MIYPWYATIKKDDPIEQGDIVPNCQIVCPCNEAKEAKQELVANIRTYDVIIMSQSCDLQAENIDIVLVCPLLTLTEFGEKFRHYKTSQTKEQLRKGQIVGLHLLNKCNINGADDFLCLAHWHLMGECVQSASSNRL